MISEQRDKYRRRKAAAEASLEALKRKAREVVNKIERLKSQIADYDRKLEALPESD